MTPQKRPLVLLHKCTECATFALGNIPVIEQNIMDISEEIRLNFTKALRLTTEKSKNTKVDFGEDEDSAYGSHSPDDSPICRSDSPSPTGRSPSNNSAPETKTSGPFRFRSMSECGESAVPATSPLKGILKRRPALVRFLSQCEEEAYDEKPGELVSNDGCNGAIGWSNEDGLEMMESGDSDECGLRNSRSQSISSKKSVRFNDRVQETLFRPNSSILGQRKKNQRKQQQRKRKRTNSGDSQTGGSENENEFDGVENVELMKMTEITVESEQDEKSAMDDGKSRLEPVEKPTKTVNKNRNENENDQKKRERAAAVLNDPRYNGFVLGNEKKQQHAATRRVRRNSSGDSALADDEEDGEVMVGVSKSKPAKRKGNHRRASLGDEKE